MNTSPILVTGPSASSAPAAYPTTLESTLDVITKQPTSQLNNPDVTPSLFSPITPEPTIAFETPEPMIITEMPTIYETPMDQTQHWHLRRPNCRQTVFRRKEGLGKTALFTYDVIMLL